MADLSKIKLNGTDYNLKDTEARSDLANKKIVTIQATYTPQDESLDPDDIVTLTETYQDLGNYATQDEVIVLLQLKIQYDRTQETRIYLHSYSGGNTRSGYFYDLTNPLCYFYYASKGVSNLTSPVQLIYIEDDMGYLTAETDPTVPAWAKASSKPTYTANEVGALPDTTVIPTVPNNVSAFNNDVGYLTSYTETDPTVPAWAKAANKPTYTATEVGALPSNTTYVSSVNGSSGAVTVDKIKTTASSNNTEYNLLGTATTNNNTAAVSTYKQDLLSFAKTTTLSRLTIGSTSLPGVVRIYTSTSGASGYTDLKSAASGTTERTISLPDANGTIALTDDIPDVPSWALNSTKPSYAFSELTSHPTTLNDYGITDAYTKTEVDGLVSGVLHYKGTKATTSALPSSGNITGDVWHITADGSEWAWDGTAWQELGTAVDLTGYLQSSDIAAWAKASTKPSYTASEVGALASNTTYVSSFNGSSGAITYTAPVTSVNEQTGAVTITVSSIGAAASTHAHGNITSGGDMTATAAIASGDRLVINDESASKLTSSTITFGSSTTQYLANNGTWQNAYDDTALAARVTALEQIPWVTYYTGSTTPSNAQGNNGDLYFQTAQ